MTEQPLLETLRGKRQSRPPIWFMRQAGRYLPEYREIRSNAPDFLSMCYTPALATEVTLQPIRRFDLDAAILFSDILVVADALGQSVRFEEGQGPVLEPVDAKSIDRLDASKVTARLAPVLETVTNVRAALSAEKTLLGFCGAPWTVATYMIGGRGSTDQAAARKFALTEPKAFDKLVDRLVDASIDYLVAQLEAGADAVQVFESWAQNVDEDMFRRLVIEPNRRIVEGVRARAPEAVIIGFSARRRRQSGDLCRADGFQCDRHRPLGAAGLCCHRLQCQCALAGAISIPCGLVAGGAQLDRRIDDIVSSFADRPHVFNLGHGVVPGNADRACRADDRAGEGALKWNGSRRYTSSRLSPGWQRCSICRVCSSITAVPR